MSQEEREDGRPFYEDGQCGDDGEDMVVYDGNLSSESDDDEPNTTVRIVVSITINGVYPERKLLGEFV